MYADCAYSGANCRGSRVCANSASSWSISGRYLRFRLLWFDSASSYWESGEVLMLNELSFGIWALGVGDSGKLLIEESLTVTLVAHSIKLRRELRSPLNSGDFSRVLSICFLPSLCSISRSSNSFPCDAWGSCCCRTLLMRMTFLSSSCDEN